MNESTYEYWVRAYRVEFDPMTPEVQAEVSVRLTPEFFQPDGHKTPRLIRDITTAICFGAIKPRPQEKRSEYPWSADAGCLGFSFQAEIPVRPRYWGPDYADFESRVEADVSKHVMAELDKLRPVAAKDRDSGKPDLEILAVKGTWAEVLDDCRSTVGKTELGKEPSSGFKTKLLISEHSPIRSISVKWIWRMIPSWVATHWARHKWEKFITTQRSDRTGTPRDKLPQDAPVNFRGEANAQHLIDTMRKRLCHNAAEETRLLAEGLKAEIHEVEPELADVLVPNCVYRGGCPELHCCGLYQQMCARDPALRLADIKERYTAYNRLFNERTGKAK